LFLQAVVQFSLSVRNGKLLLDKIAGLELMVILTALSLATPVASFADAETTTNPDVTALVVPLDSDADAFSTVVAAAVSLRFAQSGLLLDVRTLPVPTDISPTNETLSKQAGVARSAAILVCRFSVVDGEMTAEMDWRDVRTGVHTTVSGDKAEIDLSLDGYIRRVLDSLFVQVQGQIDAMAERRRTAAADLAAAPAKTPPAAPVVLAPAQPPVVGVRPTMEDDPRSRPFVVSTGIAPFIPVGAIAAYTSLGSMATATAELAFPVPWGRLGAGMSLGVVSFAAQGASGLTTSILIPLGLDASLRLGASSPAGLLFHLSGGAAVFFVNNPSIGTRAKTVPFLRGAMGVELLFSHTVGLLIDAGYDVYFEMPDLIMGVTPALELSARL
jgi:hypothetical protein